VFKRRSVPSSSIHAFSGLEEFIRNDTQDARRDLLQQLHALGDHLGHEHDTPVL
jgi:hypothetical protein